MNNPIPTDKLGYANIKPIDEVIVINTKIVTSLVEHYNTNP